MISEGLNLMAVGMGVVFAFLILMVFVMGLSARLCQWILRNEPDEEPVTVGTAAGSRPRNDERDIAAVLAAVQSYLRK